MLEDQIMSVLSSPAPHGVSLAIIGYLYMKVKRLESEQKKCKKDQDGQHIQIINNYVDLVKGNADVLSKLTICMNSMKDAINGLKDTVDRLKS